MVRGQSMGLRASLYPHAPALGHVHARSASLSRDTPRIRFFLLLPRRDARRVEEKLRAAFEQVGIVGIVGIVEGFNWVQWGV